MEEFVAEHGSAVVYIIGGFCVFLIGIVGWFLRNDRSSFLKQLTDLDTKITECEKEVEVKIKEVETEVESIKKNYNTKFEKVYDKVDSIKTAIGINHEELLKAIHRVELKIPNNK